MTQSLVIAKKLVVMLSPASAAWWGTSILPLAESPLHPRKGRVPPSFLLFCRSEFCQSSICDWASHLRCGLCALSQNFRIINTPTFARPRPRQATSLCMRLNSKHQALNLNSHYLTIIFSKSDHTLEILDAFDPPAPSTISTTRQRSRTPARRAPKIHHLRTLPSSRLANSSAALQRH